MTRISERRNRKSLKEYLIEGAIDNPNFSYNGFLYPEELIWIDRSIIAKLYLANNKSEAIHFALDDYPGLQLYKVMRI